MLARLSTLIACIALAALACIYSPEMHQGEAAGVVMQFPSNINGFIADRAEPDPIEKQLLPEDTEFAKAIYHTATADPSKRDVAHLSIVLSGAERKSIHRPEVCLVGQGWALLESRIIPMDIGPGRTLKVTDLYVEKVITLKDGEKRPLRAHYLYWFIGKDVSTPSHGERIWLTLWDNIIRNVNHRWAYVSAMAVVTEGFTPEEINQRTRDSEQTVSMVSDVVRQIVPAVQKEFMTVTP